jgi:hypothetical protein
MARPKRRRGTLQMLEVIRLDTHAVDATEDRGALGVDFRVRACAVRLPAPRSAISRCIAVHDLCALRAGHAGARGHAPAAPGAAVRARARQGPWSTRAGTAIRLRPGRVRSALALTAARRPIAPRAPSTVGLARPRARRLTAVAARFLVHSFGVGHASRRRRRAPRWQSTGTSGSTATSSTSGSAGTSSTTGSTGTRGGQDNAAAGFAARASTGSTSITARPAFFDTARSTRHGHPRRAGRARASRAARVSRSAHAGASTARRARAAGDGGVAAARAARGPAFAAGVVPRAAIHRAEQLVIVRGQ